MDAYQKERMLLGAAISGEKRAVKLLQGLEDECFSTAENKLVYGRILELSAQHKPIDPTMIAEKLTGVDAVALMQLCVSLVKEGNVWHAEQYAKDLKELGQKRRLYKLLKQHADRLEAEDLQAVLDSCREGLRQFNVVKGDVSYMPDVTAKLFDRINAAANGEIVTVKSGLPDLDRIIGGFENGDIVIVGARPAVGKSTFGMALALNAARSGKKVLVCSCEMSDVQYAQRIASEITGISTLDLKSGRLTDDQWVRIGDAMNEMSGMGVGFTFNSSYVEDLCSLCIREKDVHGLDLLVVDYIQIMDTKARVENDNLRITKISGRLKQLAMELKIPIVVLAQVKRQEGSVMRMPTLQELRGSGSLEQDADKVIFLHRVEVPSDPHCRSADALRRFQGMGDQMIAVDVAKHRDGPVGSFCTRFEPGRMRYTCLTHRDA